MSAALGTDSLSSPQPLVVCPVVFPILLLMKIKHRRFKKLAQNGTSGPVVELGFKLKYNQFLLFVVVIFCKVSPNIKLVNTELLVGGIQG